MPETHDQPLPSGHIGQGPLYDEFSNRLRVFCASRVVNQPQGQQQSCSLTTTMWGQRLLPPNTLILIWGNSHTRQMTLALLGQHQRALSSLRRTTTTGGHNDGNNNDDNDDHAILRMAVYDDRINSMARRFDLTQNRSGQ